MTCSRAEEKQQSLLLSTILGRASHSVQVFGPERLLQLIGLGCCWSSIFALATHSLVFTVDQETIKRPRTCYLCSSCSLQVKLALFIPFHSSLSSLSNA